ncbi:hypothetical protein UlMin_019874 [Ulmus minor]
MKEKMAITFSLVLFFVLHLSASATRQSPPVGDISSSFVKCMETHSNPSSLISNKIYSPTNSAFSSVLTAYIRNARFNNTATRKPLFIVTAAHESHVQAAVICTKAAGLHLKIRSGGHDYEGLSYISDTPFVLLDMFQLRLVTVDVADQSAWVQTGATLGEFYYNIWKKSRVLGFPAGVCPTVGVGGHISGGGYGNMLRKFGLAVDHVIDAKIVDAKGNILDRKSMGEDLFWAIRGGGGAAFGVILSFRLKLVPVPKIVTVFQAERYLDAKNSDMTDVVVQWQKVAPTTDDGLFMRMLIQPVNSQTKKGSKTVRITIVAMYLGNGDQLVSLLGKEFPILGLKKENVTELSWIDSVQWWDTRDNLTKPEVLLEREPNKAGFLMRKSDYVQQEITKQGLESIWKKVSELGKIGLVFNPYGGRMSQVPSTETPFPHRAGNLFKIQYSINWNEPGADLDKNYTAQIRTLFQHMTPFVSKNPRSAFLNYRDIDIGVNHWGANSYQEGKAYGIRYFNDNFDRLVKVKTAVDPENFFRNEQSVPPLTSKA